MSRIFTLFDEFPSDTGKPISSAVLMPNIFKVPVMYLAIFNNKVRFIVEELQSLKYILQEDIHSLIASNTVLVSTLSMKINVK